jgi:hypothetical protein
MPPMSFTAFSGFEHLAGSAVNASALQGLHYPAVPSTTQPMDPNPTARQMVSKANLKSSGREAALARRQAMSTKGKQGVSSTTTERTRSAPASKPAATASAPAVAAPARSDVWSAPAPSLTAAPAPVRRSAQAPRSPSQASRDLARQRRGALAQNGRKAVRAGDRVRGADTGKGASTSAPAKKDCGCGCNGERRQVADAPVARPSPSQPNLTQPNLGNGSGTSTLRSKRADIALGAKPAGRMLSLARRRALSGRGKGAAQSPNSAASLARQANPKLSGRELAQKVRDQRSTNGGIGERKSPPSGRMRAKPQSQGATDQPWKVGVTETALGQIVTGTKVGRSRKTTGDEPSTCRSVTGTEYMGADIFREFCQAEPQAAVAKVRVSPTSHGNRITGNEVGRSSKVTGDEPGTCKHVTGTEYLSPNQYGAFCEPRSGLRPEPGPAKVGVAQTRGGKPVSGNLVGRSAAVTGDEAGANVRPTGTQYTAPSDIGTEIVPPKVGKSATLGGGTVTGNRVGHSERVTGDEPGSCRLVTGDQYIDRGQYEACGINPQPEPPGTGLSMTNKGLRVSGTLTGRSGKVTGDEPGTCKAITGTPYAGLEQAAEYCEPPRQREIQARTRQLAATPGPKLTGMQPGIDPVGGGRITGAAKGACEPLTGTPYVGADQFAAACGGGNGATPGESDFPRLLDDGAPGQGFSVTSPARQATASAMSARSEAVTGTAYESSRHITGPFGMGTGKITGTEQFRFDGRKPMPELMKMAQPAPADNTAGAETPAQGSRITGEGQSAGSKITGDDWERGDRVTGTEGTSARRRNPTRPGPMGAMPPLDLKRNEETPKPVSRVTGASGGSERGALVTYSGGARG